MRNTILKKIDKKIKNLIADIGYFFIIKFHRFPNVATIDETIDKIINDNCSISRFGDGEFRAIGNKDITFQKGDAVLSERLKGIVNSNDDKILIGLPDVFSYQDINKSVRKRQLFCKKEIILNYKIYKKIRSDKKFYNAHISRPYLEYKDKNNASKIFNNFKRIWDNQDIVIVEGEGTRLGIGNDLFDNTKSILRILCPARDAFVQYENILEKCKTIDKNKIFIIALGPTATVLAYDLGKMGYQAIDVGHIDIEYEWMKMGVMKKVKVKGKFTNEVKDGQIVEEINDEKYEEQIIYKIL